MKGGRRQIAAIAIGAVLTVGTAAPFRAEALGLAAEEHPVFVVYGPGAPIEEGDPDFRQIFYILLPEGGDGPFRLQLFDAAPGSPYDTSLGSTEDASTRFALFGGPGADLGPGGTGAAADAPEGGTLLKEEVFTPKPENQDQWRSFAELDSADGEKVEGGRLFRLQVDGGGNDGNAFNVRVLSGDADEPAENVSLYTYNATLVVPDDAAILEAAFTVPADADTLTVRNFDVTGGTVFYAGPYRSELMLSSQNGEWEDGTITLDAFEGGKRAAITAAGGRESPNDLSMEVLAAKGDAAPVPLRLDLPIRILTPNRRPEAAFNVRPLDCTRVELDARASSDAEGAPLSYRWQFPDGSASAEPVVVREFDGPGRYAVRLEANDEARQIGNTGAITDDVLILPPIDATIAEAPTDLAVGEAGTFSAAPADKADKEGKAWTVGSYEWLFADGTVLLGREVEHGFAAPGVYAARLLVRDASGHPCGRATAQASVRVNAAPQAIAGPDRLIAAGETLTLDAARSSDPDGEIATHRWRIEPLDAESLFQPVELDGARTETVLEAPGRYRVSLRVDDGSGLANATAADAFELTVNAAPVAEAGAALSGIAGAPVLFEATASTDADGPIARHLWDFGDGATAEGAIVRHAFAGPGTYTATLTVNDGSGAANATDTDTVAVTVAPKPNLVPLAEAGPDLALVAGQPFELSAAGSADPDGQILAYDWDFGDGRTASGLTVRHAFERPGTYTATLTVADNGTPQQSASDTVTLRVAAPANAAPTAEAGPARTATAGEPLTFTAEAGDPDGYIARYRWRFGDGAEAEGPEVTYAFPTPGAYEIELLVEDDGGLAATDTAAVTVAAPVNRVPEAEAGPDITVAPGETVRFDGSASNDPDGRLIAFDWDFGDGSSASGPAPTHIFKAPGTYPVRLTVQDNAARNTGHATDSLTVTVNHPPIAVAGGDRLIAEGDTLTLDAGASRDPDGEIAAYRWIVENETGETTELEGVRAEHLFDTPGHHMVTLALDDGSDTANSSASDSFKVTVNAAPAARFTGPEEAIAGDPVTFDASASADSDSRIESYRWSFGDGASGTGVKASHTYFQPGTYSVRLTVSDASGASNASASAEKTISVGPRLNAAPVAEAGPDQTASVGTPVSFDGTKSADPDGNLVSYRWDFGDGRSADGPMPTHAYWKPGTYEVTLDVADNSGDTEAVASDTLTVTVTAPGNRGPEADAGGNRTATVGERVTFDAAGSSDPDGNVVGYSWVIGEDAKVNGITAVHAFAAPGTYPVRLTVEDDAGAAASDEIAVTVTEGP